MASAGYAPHGGHSNQFRKQDDYGNYAFGYDIVDPYGANNFRKEHGDAYGAKVGSYGLHDADGRVRIVDYVADKHGFRAKIRTNEPGTANKDPAAAVFNGPDTHGYSHSVIPAGHVPPKFNPGPIHAAHAHPVPAIYGHHPYVAHGHHGHHGHHAAPHHGYGHGHGHGHLVHVGHYGHGHGHGHAAHGHGHGHYGHAPYGHGHGH